jgi:hypothetical protein
MPFYLKVMQQEFWASSELNGVTATVSAEALTLRARLSALLAVIVESGHCNVVRGAGGRV